MVAIACPLLSQTQGPSPEVKKEAARLFEEEDYTKAYKLYSQLVANYPKDPEYNYKLGVCMIYSEPDKKKCLPYLQFAARNSNEATKDVSFYLGKAYHINYLFDEAIKNYNDYKRTASSSQQKKLQVDHEIAACNFGKKLLSNMSDLVVLSKKELSEADYFRSYDVKSISGKLLAKPDEFKSSADKKKNDRSVVFLPKSGDRVYYSSYGDGDNGRDIYYAVKMANGTYSKPVKVNGINTEFDEDYPFLHPNGHTLYFASKGHNSMGGYDIFKSEYNEGTDSWSAPVNLEFPINSPDDDYLFVTDSLEKTAYFSTGRQSPPGKTDVLKINTERKPIDIVAISGSVTKDNAEQSLKSKISVSDAASKKPLGIYYAEDNGDYTLEVPNGAKLLLTVETPGQKVQSAEIALPLATTSQPFKQTISYPEGVLKIVNDFDAPSTEDNYKQYLKVIEKKAKLDVNEGENKLSSPGVATTAPKEKSAPQLTGETAAETPTATGAGKSGMDNKQLASIAKQDAQESRQEATQLKQDSNDALEVGQQQKDAAAKKMTEADEALKGAEAITNEEEKKPALEKATALKQEAENDAAVAEKILAFGKSLNDDAIAKQKEADLNEQYATELEKAISAKNSNPQALAKLDELQKQINELSSQKNESENVFNAIKTDVDDKEKQLASLESINSSVRSNLDEIKTAIAENDAELANTKKKKDKEAIINRTDELKTEQAEKESQLAKNDAEIKKLNEELGGLKNELSLANKIKSETIAAVTTPTVSSSPTPTTSVAKEKTQPVAVAKKTEKPAAKTTVAKTTTPKTTAAPKDNKPDYAPLAASTPAEAITKLNNLDAQLATNDNDIFDFNGYQDPQAQSLKVEADAKINDAVVELKKLKESIAASKQELSNTPATTAQPVAGSQQLNKEGDDLAVQAQELRSKADAAPADQKETLITQAKELEGKADSKYIEAAAATGQSNKAQFDTNKENISGLVAQGKMPQADADEAKRLTDEADLAFKQSISIREEAVSLSSSGAKLGNLSNAEEIESGALAKQQQAVELLKKSNAAYALKTVPVAAVAANNSEVSQKLDAVNKSVANLAALKNESYEKLYAANNTEIEKMLGIIGPNQELINASPALKKDYIAGNNNVEAAKTLKQKSESSSEPGDKLNNLTAAIKKQLEAIKQLNTVEAAVNKAIATRDAAIAQQKAAQEAKAAATNSPVATNTEPAKEPPVTNTAKEPEPVVSTPTVAAVTVNTVDIQTLAKQDSTPGQLLAYFDNNSPALKNVQAGNTVKKSIEDLKKNEADLKTVEDKIANYQPSTTAAPLSPIELVKNADALLVESEDLNGKANALKSEANNKEGAEKDSLLAGAQRLDAQAQGKKIEASELYKQANSSDYATNNNAINELLAKVKTDNPAASADLEAKNAEIQTLSEQSRKLREEADALSNPAAKLGAISNVEEKEAEMIQKQAQLIAELKKQYPDYQVKPVNAGNTETPEELAQQKNRLLEKQYTGLTNLTNAFSLEYEASKNAAATTGLNANQQALKDNAASLNTESKRLLVAASQEKNETEKLKLLTLAARSGNAAVDQLNKLIAEKPNLAKNNKAPKTNTSELDKVGADIAAANKPAPKTKTPPPAKPPVVPAAKPEPAVAANKSSVKIDGLEVTRGNAYNAERPIPVDAKMEDGLVFRVQIGAFKTRLANDAFKGLSPLNGETTPSGYIRYTAGNFNKLENANAVKNDLRNLGYRDAFVVVYYNGKRIPLNEALVIMDKEGKTIDTNAPQTAGITESANVPKAVITPATAEPTPQETVEVAKELEQTNGLLYTIQVGVFTRQVTKRQLLSLRPIFTEKLANGLFRYTAGIYNNADRLINDKRRVVEFGVKDAFVSAYLNGKRIPFSEGKQKQAEDTTVKMEAENPIIFPEAGAETTAAPANTVIVQTPVSTGTVQPFKNNVSSAPAPTEENGVKANEEGITYKVQIGAFSKQVPEDVASKFLAITTWPIENKQINGLFIYNIGNFSEVKFAKQLKDEALKLGITDAFITVYKNGVKLYGNAATEALSK